MTADTAHHRGNGSDGGDGPGARAERGAGARHTLAVAEFEAMLFDMDGVITRSANCHGDLWKIVLDEFLEAYCERTNTPFRPFDPDVDYHNYVDGKPRYDGVVSFLASRGMMIPFGEPTDDETTETCCGLGNRKNRLFLDHMDQAGIEVYESTVDLIRRLRERHVRIAVVSASKNAEAVLRRAGLFDLFDVCVSGREAAALSLAGKPAPDTYLHAAELLSTPAARSVVFEDSVTGVQAAKAAEVGMIVGIDRADDAPALFWHGADDVISDLAELELT